MTALLLLLILALALIVIGIATVSRPNRPYDYHDMEFYDVPYDRARRQPGQE